MAGDLQAAGGVKGDVVELILHDCAGNPTGKPKLVRFHFITRQNSEAGRAAASQGTPATADTAWLSARCAHRLHMRKSDRRSAAQGER